MFHVARRFVLLSVVASCVAPPEVDGPPSEEPEAAETPPLPARSLDARPAATPDTASASRTPDVPAPADFGQAVDAAATDIRQGGEALPTVTADLPFRARFAQGDLSGWTPLTGTWALCRQGAEAAYCQSDAVQSATFAGNPNWTNYDVRVVAVIVDDAILGYVQVNFRVQSTDNYWALHVGRPYGNGIAEWEMAVHSKSGYGHTNGGAFFYVKGVPFTIHFTVNGPTVSLDAPNAKGEVHQYKVTHSKLPLSGRIGLGSKGQAVRFLSVEVNPL